LARAKFQLIKYIIRIYRKYFFAILIGTREVNEKFGSELVYNFVKNANSTSKKCCDKISIEIRRACALAGLVNAVLFVLVIK
jgi:hypothetical protein